MSVPDWDGCGNDPWQAMQTTVELGRAPAGRGRHDRQNPQGLSEMLGEHPENLTDMGTAAGRTHLLAPEWARLARRALEDLPPWSVDLVRSLPCTAWFGEGAVIDEELADVVPNGDAEAVQNTVCLHTGNDEA